MLQERPRARKMAFPPKDLARLEPAKQVPTLCGQQIPRPKTSGDPYPFRGLQPTLQGVWDLQPQTSPWHPHFDKPPPHHVEMRSSRFELVSEKGKPHSNRDPGFHSARRRTPPQKHGTLEEATRAMNPSPASQKQLPGLHVPRSPNFTSMAKHSKHFVFASLYS